MALVQVKLKLFTSVEDLATFVFRLVVDSGVSWVCDCARFVTGLCTFPGFDLPVHGVFVAFPVVLAAKAARAVREGAAVGAGVPLFMFSI